MVNTFVNRLQKFLNSEKAVNAWNKHYETVYVPTLHTYQSCAKEVLKEFSNRFTICNNKIEQIVIEVDKIISELRAEATKRPQNMSKEEEIAYILKKADENCDHIEIRKILNVSNT